MHLKLHFQKNILRNPYLALTLVLYIHEDYAEEQKTWCNPIFPFRVLLINMRIKNVSTMQCLIQYICVRLNMRVNVGASVMQ